MAHNTRRDFLRQTAFGTAAMVAYPRNILGANDRVRVGMIGVGNRGQDLLAQIVTLPNIEMVAIADVYRRRHEEAKKIAPNITAFDDHRRLLDVKDIDAVIVASPLHTHARHFFDSLSAGKDLYCEKTMTWSIPEAERCLAAAQASDRIVQIGLQWQSSRVLADARNWVTTGLVGKVTQVECWMSRNTPHGKGQWVRPVPSDCTAEHVNWAAFLDGRPERPLDPYRLINWRLFWEFSGGNITENMVHQIAWIMSTLDLPLPMFAYTSGGVFSEKDGREVPDTIAVTLDFPNDLVVTWQSTFSNRHYGLGDRILGSDGTIEHGWAGSDMANGEHREYIRYYAEPVNRPHSENLTDSSPGGHAGDRDHLTDWVGCIRARKAPKAPAEIGYRSALACHMANLAYRRKERVSLKEAKSFVPEF
ncbi:MAG: Gfo/Idh/MocA family oxidoreductase [Acidobacteria bacterium]|nr:Gfo/Idh/MocA family oxidoreductase [Acidobacteriota bacterium]